MNSYLVAIAVALAVLWVLYRGRLRLALSAAKHRSLAGHARWSRRIARLLPYYEYSEQRFFVADGAPEEVAERRRAGRALTAAARCSILATTMAATTPRSER